MNETEKDDLENSKIKDLRKRIKRFASQAKQGIHSARFDSSDIAQLACLQVWQAWQGVEDAGVEHLASNNHLLKKICFGQTANLIRFHCALRRTPKREDHGTVENVPTQRTPLENVEGAEDLALLLAAIDRLGTESRELIVMRYEQCMTFEEIAAAKNRSTNWVFRHLKKSLSQLSHYMSR